MGKETKIKKIEDEEPVTSQVAEKDVVKPEAVQEAKVSASEQELTLEELAVAETGVPVEAEITGIVVQKCIEFPQIQRIKNEAIRQRWLERKDAKCVQITVKTEAGEYTLFPIRISNNPRSTFYRLLKKYGQKEGNVYKLKPGMKIKIVFTERGFPRVYLPE